MRKDLSSVQEVSPLPSSYSQEAISITYTPMSTWSKVCVCVRIRAHLVTKVLSNSLQLKRLQPARLFYPCDSPGMNTGLPFPPPGHLYNPGIKLASPALQANSLPLSH